jgi:peptidoglycan-associated lipoprotein
MSIRFGSYSGIIVTVLSVMLVTGCSKRPPLQPDMQTTEGRMGPAESAQTESLAMQRERERQAAIEERERQVAEESMRRRIADTQSPMMSQEDFVNQDVHFAYDSHILNEEAKALLERKATWLDQHSQIKFQIEGHCDERGTTVYNLVLGERRAHAVKQYLILAIRKTPGPAIDVHTSLSLVSRMIYATRVSSSHRNRLCLYRWLCQSGKFANPSC